MIKERSKILIISPTPSHPQSSGSRMRIFTIMNHLKEQGHDIYLVHLTREAGDNDQMTAAWQENFFSVPYQNLSVAQRVFDRLLNCLALLPLPINIRRALTNKTVDYWYNLSLNKFISELHENIKFDAVIINYVLFSKALECFDKNVIKVIDTLDVFTDRHLLYIKNREVPSWYSISAVEESKGLERADLILAIQDQEAAYLRSITTRSVLSLGHLLPPQKIDKVSSPRKKLLFISSITHPNVQGIKIFINNCLPRLRALFPNLELLIAGTICSEIPDSEGCVKLGFIADVAEIYQHADIVINVTTFGTGLKIKSIEALAFGKVLVTTPCGAEGMEHGMEQAFLVANNDEQFVNKLGRLLSDHAYFQEIAENGYNFAVNYYQQNIDMLNNIFTPAQETDYEEVAL